MDANVCSLASKGCEEIYTGDVLHRPSRSTIFKCCPIWLPYVRSELLVSFHSFYELLKRRKESILL
jgi:hypothetical protein